MKTLTKVLKISMLFAIITLGAYAVYSKSSSKTHANKMKTAVVTITGAQSLANCGNGAAYVVVTTSSGSNYKVYNPSISTYNFEFGMNDTGFINACIEFQTTPPCCGCEIACPSVPIGPQNSYALSINVNCTQD